MDLKQDNITEICKPKICGIEGVVELSQQNGTNANPLDEFEHLPVIERPAECTIPDAPVERGRILFLSPDGSFACGIWQGEAGIIPIARYPVNEFCTLLEGEVVLEDINGKKRIFHAGDHFLIPEGFQGSWTMPVKSKKLFVCGGKPEQMAFLLGVPT